MLNLKTLVVVLSVVLTGCAGGGPALNPQGREAGILDAGDSPTDPEAVIRRALRDYLKDPASAQVENVTVPGFMAIGESTFYKSVYGWWVCADVNAKNSLGGYVGFQKTLVVYLNGAIVRYMSEDPKDIIKTDYVQRACHEVLTARRYR